MGPEPGRSYYTESFTRTVISFGGALAWVCLGFFCCLFWYFKLVESVFDARLKTARYFLSLTSATYSSYFVIFGSISCLRVFHDFVF